MAHEVLMNFLLPGVFNYISLYIAQHLGLDEGAQAQHANIYATVGRVRLKKL